MCNMQYVICNMSNKWHEILKSQGHRFFLHVTSRQSSLSRTCSPTSENMFSNICVSKAHERINGEAPFMEARVFRSQSSVAILHGHHAAALAFENIYVNVWCMMYDVWNIYICVCVYICTCVCVWPIGDSIYNTLDLLHTLYYYSILESPTCCRYFKGWE